MADLLSGRNQCLLSFSTSACRQQESYRRTKQKLNIQPDASFLPSGKIQPDHIIFNPPSSAPSVLHTPLIFLPKDDKRKALLLKSAAKFPTPSKLPPVIKKFKPLEEGIRHHLKEADIAEIQRLRLEDPDKWTARKLGVKFNCSTFFVAMCCRAPSEKLERDKEKFEAMTARWGPKRTKAREDRWKRMELAVRGA